MGFLDKAKEAAAAAQAATKGAVQKGEAKLDEVQSKRAADSLLRDLGAAYYAQHTGRASDSVEIARLMSALEAHEAAKGALNLDPGGSAGGESA